jgi:hypothetical protein
MTGAGASFSACRRYRYALWREWDATLPTVVFCGLNPSTADEMKDDPTIRRELGFARDWGFGRLVKVNAYGWRDTHPKKMLAAEDPVGPENLATVVRCAQRAALFVAGWGNNIRASDALTLITLLRRGGVAIHVLRLTGKGNPEHPLYLPRNLRPVTWPGGKPWARTEEITK